MVDALFGQKPVPVPLQEESTKFADKSQENILASRCEDPLMSLPIEEHDGRVVDFSNSQPEQRHYVDAAIEQMRIGERNDGYALS